MSPVTRGCRRIAGTNLVAAGETHQFIAPTSWRFDAAQAGRGVIAPHGAGGAPDQYDTASPGWATWELMKAGFPLLQATLGGGSTWGNDTAIARMTDLYNYSQSQGRFATKVHLLGTSMGTLTALNWARANLAKVQSVVVIVPALHLQEIHELNQLGFAATIATSAGGSANLTSAYYDTHDPYKFRAELAGIPIKLLYSATDAFLASRNITFAASSGLHSAEAIPGANGHDMTLLDPAKVAAWFTENS